MKLSGNNSVRIIIILVFIFMRAVDAFDLGDKHENGLLVGPFGQVKADSSMARSPLKQCNNNETTVPLIQCSAWQHSVMTEPGAPEHLVVLVKRNCVSSFGDDAPAESAMHYAQEIHPEIHTPALLLYEIAAHCYNLTIDPKDGSNGIHEVVVELFWKEMITKAQHFTLLECSQNVFRLEPVDSLTTRQWHSAPLCEVFCRPRNFANIHSDFALRVTPHVEIMGTGNQANRFSAYCKGRGPFPLNQDAENVSGEKPLLSIGKLFNAPTYTEDDERGKLSFVRAATTSMEGFHRLAKLQILYERKAFRDGEKPVRHLQLIFSTHPDKVFLSWLLGNAVTISRIPLDDLLMLSTGVTLFICFAVAVCFGAIDYLVLATAGLQHTAKLDAKLKNKSQRLLLIPSPRGASKTTLGLLYLFLSAIIVTSTRTEATNLRQNITDGNVECLHYIKNKAMFRMTCDVLVWKWDAGTYISLGANETFDGGGAASRDDGYLDGKGIIDLTGIDNFKGIISVDENDVESFAEAPLIRNVHVKNGTTAFRGGFIVQEEQNYFIVDSCSSTGDIERDYGGGICGRKGGYQGEIKISNSYSTGRIKGKDAGGIAGTDVGRDGIAHITQCHSTGDIEEDNAGGICGLRAGWNGKVNITQSYSTGDILGYRSGGITGRSTGLDDGCVYIRECYTKGKIAGDESGGICGSYTSNNDAEVHVIDCYSRGDIDGDKAGGITGFRTGQSGGDVYIENTYASGNINPTNNAGGLIGRIAVGSRARDIVDVKYSVYNYHNASKMVGTADSPTTSIGNSYDLNDIRGKLYTFDGTQRWSNNIWALNGTDKIPILRFQLLESRKQQRPTPSPSATRTAPPTESPSPSATLTPTASSTTTGTPSPTSSVSPTLSGTATASATNTRSPTRSASPSATQTPTPSKSPRGLTTKKVLPVQRPARHVDSRSQRGRRDRKRRKNK